MTLLTTYDSIPQEQWQQLVLLSPVATWFQTPEGFRFLEQVNDFTPFVVAVAEDERLVGLCVGQISHSRSRLVQFLTRRAVINGGPLLLPEISPEALRALLKAVNDITDRRAIFAEVRCFHDYSAWRELFAEAGWHYEKHLNFHIPCSDHNAMWQHLSENRRRQLSRAKSLGVRIDRISREEDLRAWYTILRRLYRRHVHKPLPSIDFFRVLMQQQLLLGVRAPGGQIIGGIACVKLPGKALYEWYICGLDEQCRPYAPSVVATWAAMEYAYRHGMPLFDVMGAGRPDVPYGVREFKQKFGGELVEHGRWIRVSHPFLYRLGEAVFKTLNITSFPSIPRQ